MTTNEPTRVINLLDNNLHCHRCGGVEEYGNHLPAPIEVAVPILKTFGKRHRHCRLTQGGKDLKANAQRAWGEHLKEKADAEKNQVESPSP